MLKTLRVLAVLCGALGGLSAFTNPVSAQCPPKTTISDTLFNADGSLASGRVVIVWQTFQIGACQVIAGQLTAEATNGALNIQLYPNTTTVPTGTSYRATYYLKSGKVTTEYWVVPVSSSPVALALVRSASVPAPQVMFGQAQVTNLFADLAKKLELPSPCPVGKFLMANGAPAQPQVDCVDLAGGGGSATVHKVNGVNLLSNSIVNFQSTSTISLSNPSTGDIQATIPSGSIIAALLSVQNPSSAQLFGLSDFNAGASAFSPNRIAGTAEVQSNKGAANGYASLNASSKVIQDPANAQTTPAAAKIPLADGSGKIADGWLSSNVSLLGSLIDLNTETNGTLPFFHGGTNQTSWTASRCARTNSGGTALESAPGDCPPIGSPYIVLAADPTLTGERVISARDNLAATDFGAGGNFTLDFNPLDTSTVWIYEDFHGGATSSGQIGTHGWLTNSIGASPTVSRVVAALPNSGIFRFTTTSTAAQGTYVSLGGTGFEMLGELGSVTNWESVWIFRLGATSSVRFRIGLAAAAAAAAEPNNGVWLRFDTSTGFADTNFQFETRSASSSTVASTGVAGDTGWHKLHIRSTSTGTISFSLDGGAEQNITSTVPTVALTPFLIIVTDTTAARSADADLFVFKIRGLNR